MSAGNRANNGLAAAHGGMPRFKVARNQKFRRTKGQKCSRNTPHLGHLANHMGTLSPHLQRMLCRTTDELSALLLAPGPFSSGALSKIDESVIEGSRPLRSSRTTLAAAFCRSPDDTA